MCDYLPLISGRVAVRGSRRIDTLVFGGPDPTLIFEEKELAAETVRAWQTQDWGKFSGGPRPPAMNKPATGRGASMTGLHEVPVRKVPEVLLAYRFNGGCL